MFWPLKCQILPLIDLKVKNMIKFKKIYIFLKSQKKAFFEKSTTFLSYQMPRSEEYDHNRPLKSLWREIKFSGKFQS